MIPSINSHVYFRYDSKQTVMITFNPTKKEIKLNMKRYYERVNSFKSQSALDVISGTTVSFVSGEMILPPMSVQVMVLQ